MKERPLRTTVIGSMPFPGWLEYASQHLEEFGATEIDEMVDDAVRVTVQDQVQAGLDVITDGEQTRLDFNLSFYGHIEGIDREPASPRKFGPSGHDQRGKHTVTSVIRAPKGLGVVAEFERLRRLAPQGPVLKASVPGPYTLSGRLVPNSQYKDRYALTEALLPIVRGEIEALVKAGCREIAIDEPSMSCYAWREDTKKMVDIFNRTVEPAVGKSRLTTHLCFGNFKGKAVAKRRYSPMFPAFLEFKVDEMHVEMASREFAEIELAAAISQKMDVVLGVIDVKNYYVETPQDVVERVKLCLKYVPADKLSLAPDCGLSQTARWAAVPKLNSLVQGVKLVRQELSL